MTLNTVLHLLPLAVPLLLLAGSLTSGLASRWTAAQWLNGAAFLFALLSTSLLIPQFGAGGWPDGLVSRSPASLLMAVLVSFIALVIVRFSHQYLRGEPRESHYLAMLQLTLAAVACVVLTDHLLALMVAWVLISLGLHRLLLFYPDRPRAALAAHKKFLFARVAEAALLIAVLLLYRQHGTWNISEILAAYPAQSLSTAEQLAALCLAVAALVKCAQLPVHGWLIQVVEAPTPVSALLHAGIINLGGYLLILFAPLFAQAAAAQWLVLLVAGTSTVLAALIMSTRISIKVKLAWSTSAQMGLMLVECALGLFNLALLHLLAHSCYKAWTFLSSGSAVEQDLRRRLALPRKPTARQWLMAAALAFPLALVPMTLLAPAGPYSPWILLAAAMTVLIAERDGTNQRGPLAGALAAAVLLIAAYALQKAGIGVWVPAQPASAGLPADVFVALLVALLLAAHVLLLTRPENRFVRRLSAMLYAGFYLDEWATRATLRIWPVRLPERLNPKQLAALSAEVSR